MINKFRALCPILTRGLALCETLELSYLNHIDTHGCHLHWYYYLVNYLIFLSVLIAACEHRYDISQHLLSTDPHPNTLALAPYLQPDYLPPRSPIIRHHVLPHIPALSLPPLEQTRVLLHY